MQLYGFIYEYMPVCFLVSLNYFQFKGTLIITFRIKMTAFDDIEYNFFEKVLSI